MCQLSCFKTVPMGIIVRLVREKQLRQQSKWETRAFWGRVDAMRELTMNSQVVQLFGLQHDDYRQAGRIAGRDFSWNG